MFNSPLFLLLSSSSTTLVLASPLLQQGAAAVSGVATFNNYETQTGTVCGSFSPSVSYQMPHLTLEPRTLISLL